MEYIWTLTQVACELVEKFVCGFHLELRDGIHQLFSGE